MKTIFTLFVLLTATVTTSKAQFTANFDNNIASLSDNCWIFNQVDWTNTPGEVISGTGSLYTNPPVNGSSTRDIISPALNINSTSFTVGFDYKLTSKINGNATRTIEIGLLDLSNNFISLAIITLDKNSPITVINYTNTFTVTTGLKKLMLKVGGATGDGNSRVILDNLTTSANSQYGPTNYCNSAPVAVNDIVYGIMGTPATGNVLTNDTEPDGETMTPAIVTNSTDGVVILNADGSFTFTPDLSFSGLITTFTYRLSDNGFAPLSSNIATVTINFGAAAGSLPVKLTSFTANLKNTNVELAWTTVEEKNFNLFEVERSFNGADYKTISIVFANGNMNSKTNYSYNDNVKEVAKSIIYYRLKMVDIDGSFKYSDVRVIRIGEQAETAKIVTYPNPVVNEVRVTIPASWQNKEVKYEVFNLNGQAVKVKMNTNASQTEVIDMNNLSRGMYIIKLTKGTETAQQKIIKN